MIGSFFNPILAGATAASMLVDFVASTQSTDAGTGITFSNLSTPTPDFNFWTFGDGSFSTASDPNKTYTGEGTYSVILRSVDAVSGGIEEKTDYIFISGIEYTNATGGITEEYNLDGKRWRSHTFNSSGNFEVTEIGNGNRNLLDYLIIGGGGGGNHCGGGGGGAGGYRTTVGISGGQSSPESRIAAQLQTYAIIVGAGGTGFVNSTSTQATNGSTSSVFGIEAIGGGFGAEFNTAAGNGGSGGGACSGTIIIKGLGTSGQGTDGGTASGGVSLPGGGGGGGADNEGEAGSTKGGDGGAGLGNIIRTGSIEYRGGGGGGGNHLDANGVGAGGLGGGGAARAYNVNASGFNGDVNTGGGAGAGSGRSGAFCTPSGGNGGSGIVIIRYEIAPTS